MRKSIHHQVPYICKISCNYFNYRWNSDNRVPGLQPLVYEVPSTEESCSSTEDEDCQKVSRRSQISTASSSRVEGSKVTKLPTLGTWTKRLSGLRCHQPEPRMRKARKLCWSTQLVTRNRGSLSYLRAWQTELSLIL